MARSTPRGPLLPGAIKLRALLDAENLSAPAFCELYGLDRFKVQRALNGTARRVDVEFAGAIETATTRNGKPIVTWRDWLLVAPKRRARRSASARTAAA